MSSFENSKGDNSVAQNIILFIIFRVKVNRKIAKWKGANIFLGKIIRSSLYWNNELERAGEVACTIDVERGKNINSILLR